jgi:Methylase of chemotaxis methyl-accepting proteins
LTEDYPEPSIINSPTKLKQLSRLITEKMGLNFTENRQLDIWQAVQVLSREQGQEDVESFIQSLITSSLTEQQVQLLSDHLTVGETYFFREMKSLEVFRDYVIPGLIRHRSERKKRLRIWSAGCSTGEEPYTLAMLIDQLIPEAKRWDIRIYGTDINLQALEKARRGVYTKWSFRATPDTLRDRYFEPIGRGTYEVKAQFKDLVEFSYLNLAADDYPSLLNNTYEMDIIFCRNVMIYFTPQMVQQLIQRFHRCLVEGGWLIVAPSETSALLASEFSAVPFDGATLYQKVRQETPVSKVWAPATPIEPVSSVAPSAAKLFQPVPSMWSETCQVSPVISSASRCKDNLQRYKDALGAYQNGQYDEAIVMLQKIFTENGFREDKWETDGNVLPLMARILVNQGHIEEAVKWCEKAIAADKLNPKPCFLLAMILLEQGQDKAAVQALKRSLYLSPDFIAAYYLMGTIAVKENRLTDANRYFQQAVLLLAKIPKENPLPELDGMTAGRLSETIQTMLMEGGIKQ